MPPEAAALVAGSAVGPEGDADRAHQADAVGAATAVVSATDSAEGARSALPGVLVDVPVAVLVIDQKAGSVVYANTAAVELAGNVQLPVPIDQWGTAAGLTSLAGEPLERTSSPLSQVAEGSPVSGEAVRLAPSSTQDEMTLWVTGFPLSAEPVDDQLALVVFLRLEGDQGDSPDRRLQTMRDRAVLATDICFTISDPRRDDDPLVWVNPAFCRVSGYSYEESVGRNCRFLQGPATDRGAVLAIRRGLESHEPFTETLLNYRKDGTVFWNQVSISPVFDGAGELVSFVGVQTDVTERVRTEGERAAAFEAEQTARREAETARAAAEQAQADAEHAREEAEAAQNRLALMAEATSSLTATLDRTELLGRLADLCVPLLADWIFVTVVDAHGEVLETAAKHRRGLTAELETISSLHAANLTPGSPSRQAMESRRPVVVEELTDARLDSVYARTPAREAHQRLGGHAVVAVPMIARRRVLGAMALVLTGEDRSFTDPDVELVQDLARRAGLALDNVRLYQAEHQVAETLQRSLLPQLPDIPGVSSAAHYVSASTAADVGGDFYDLLQLPDGAIGVAIGDVVGHDVAAAAAMGHLRGLLRACMWDPTDPDPAAVLGRVDRLVQGLHVASMATMAYVRAVPPAGEGRPWQLVVANAGHPPLVLRHPDGHVQVLTEPTGLLVGVDGDTRRESVHLEVPAGTVLVGYTDGLIEHPGADLDEGIAALVDRLGAADVGAGPVDLCAHAIDTELDRRDDVALIAVRFG
ncbi:PAS domain S-box-containing protein [Klenkia marina]|uniref:PAS domain S-box-containing protein n=1 Tax=Klenkia marina TaxID=1960309 RepID=A0A1G4XNV4_9ACTN|nr:PAS domain S-box-containing protein [Klenkia marina]